MAGEDVALKIILSAIDDTGQGLKSASEKLQKTGETMQRLGTMATLGLTAPLAVLGKTAIDAASDANESLNKMQVVFGTASAQVDSFTKNAAGNLGMSRQAAQEAAATFGNLFVAMKIGQPQAADMSTSILKLAADLASFNNVRPDEALEALRSGLVGETEPLRRFGVNINEARIQEEALRLGLAKQGDTLDAAQKAQAAYSLIMQDTKTAQGDFARTSDGLANSQRIAMARFQDASAQLGASLLPLMLQAVNIVNTLMGAFSGLSPQVQGAVVVGLGLLAVMGPLVGLVGTMITIVNAVRAATIIWTAAQWLLNFALSANPIGIVIIAIAALAAGIFLAYQHSGAFRDAIHAAWGALQGFGDWIDSHLRPILNWLGSQLSNIAGAARSVGGVLGGVGGLHIPGFQTGGIVPGPVGVPMLAVVHGGERIVPAGNTYNLTLHGAGAVNDPEGVRRMLLRMEFLGAAS